MRIQLILSIFLMTLNAHANSGSTIAADEKAIKELFLKYESVMEQKKVELIDEVFTTQFIKESGNKNELVKKIKDLPPSKRKTTMTWKKGLKGEIYFAKIKETSSDKKKKEVHEAEFIILRENGKLKINGTISDGN